jgi:predicted RNase H-like HicB family nuclease
MDVDFELEEDGRWIAEVINLPRVLAYGSTREETQAKAEILAHEVIKIIPRIEEIADGTERSAGVGGACGERGA